MKLIKKKMMWSALVALAGLTLLLTNVFYGGNIRVTTGFASGILGISLLRLAQFYGISKSPKRLKRYEIKQKEERTVEIAEKSGHFTFIITLGVAFVSIFVLMLIKQKDTAMMVSFVVSIQIIIYLASYFYLSKTH